MQAWPDPDLLQRAERALIYAGNTADIKIIYKRGDNNSCALTLDWAPRITLSGDSDASFDLAHSISAFVALPLVVSVLMCCCKPAAV